MEGLSLFHAHVRDLHDRARKLTSTSLSLATLFAEEADRLSREDEASRLRALYFSIRRQLCWGKSNETSASYAHSQASLKKSLLALGIRGTIAMVSKNKQVSAIADNLLRNLGDEQPPFGTVWSASALRACLVTWESSLYLSWLVNQTGWSPRSSTDCE